MVSTLDMVKSLGMFEWNLGKQARPKPLVKKHMKLMESSGECQKLRPDPDSSRRVPIV